MRTGLARLVKFDTGKSKRLVKFDTGKLKELVKVNTGKLKRLRLKLELRGVAYNGSDCETSRGAYVWLQEPHLFNEL